MIELPSSLPGHLKEAWIQATESAFQEGVEKTILHLSKQLGRNLSVNVDAEFLAGARRHSLQVVYLEKFK
ncbi:MAG: hypothetical protein R3E93_09715 [Thiothrix sp.]